MKYVFLSLVNVEPRRRVKRKEHLFGSRWTRGNSLFLRQELEFAGEKNEEDYGKNVSSGGRA
ncbi:MAG TPA: hypothetical protein DDY20_02995 [Desulfobulbaceae bacterium]|nr:hypothetical protein [Desulfobulbaceae bacterium]